MGSRPDKSGSDNDRSASDGLLTAGVLAIALARGVARSPVEPRTTPAERPLPRGGGRSGAGPHGGHAADSADQSRGRAGDSDGERGRQADSPGEIPARGFVDVAKRVATASKADNLTLLAAGVAFYSVLALFPAIVAIVSIYTLVADPAEVQRQLASLTNALPAEAADIIVERIEDLAASKSNTLGVSAAIGIGAALWSASSGMSWLLRALTLIYGEKENRKFVPLRGLSLLLTLGAAVGLVLSLTLIAGASALAERAGLGDLGQTVVSIGRWPALGLVMIVGLAVLYRYGPNREAARWSWVSWGSVIAMALWLVASGGFAVYVGAMGDNESYGSLAGVIVLMLWLWLTCVAILLGAQVNAELEHQTVRDTTTGEREPLGERGAYVADSVAPAADRAADDRQSVPA